MSTCTRTDVSSGPSMSAIHRRELKRTRPLPPVPRILPSSSGWLRVPRPVLTSEVHLVSGTLIITVVTLEAEGGSFAVAGVDRAVDRPWYRGFVVADSDDLVSSRSSTSSSRCGHRQRDGMRHIA